MPLKVPERDQHNLSRCKDEFFKTQLFRVPRKATTDYTQSAFQSH